MQKVLMILKIIGILIIFFLLAFWYNHYMKNEARKKASQILLEKYQITFETEEAVYDKWTKYKDDCVPKYSRETYRIRAYIMEHPESKFWIILDKKLNYIADEYKK